ncbi:MAG TPA: SAM-dependent methyltransferase [Pseudonocardiaceae bacterium]|jgi:hypothetical protein|nr:SAM-dependent methyltransferase [Pseudonocardiaceae bacterium]
MQERRPATDWIPAGVDTTMPNAARVYDWYLDGANNFDVDREFGRRAEQLLPDVKHVARMNRQFLGRAVRELTEAGVDQFIDLGSGIPTAGNVHEVAQKINPASRVIYVDNEPVAVAHSQLILEGNERADIVAADIRDPDAVLRNPVTRRILDFDRPIVVIMCTILHFVLDQDNPQDIVKRYRDASVPGSYLVISHGTTDNRPDLQAFGDAYRGTANQVQLRPRPDVEQFFDGYELIEPGLVFTPAWRSQIPVDADEAVRSGVYAGVGRKL